MAEAKIKRRKSQAFLQHHPRCCYCGGSTPATTIDHVPSRQMFNMRLRPKGLEVPACRDCNNATSPHEQVAAMVGRLLPDSATKDEQREMHRIMRGVDSGIPGLHEEMLPTVAQETRFLSLKSNAPAGANGVVNCSGPLLNKSMQIFGAKLGFALHYEKTTHIVPPTGGVAVLWYTNADAIAGGIPTHIFDILGELETLEQGSWSVGDQFSFAYAITEDKRMAAYFSWFRLSFAVNSWVCEDVAGFNGIDVAKVHRPRSFCR